MKFSKSGRIVLALLVSLGASLGITSCSSDYTIGYLYVTGTTSLNNSSPAGQVSGFKISDINGSLTPIAESPFGTSGPNPRRTLVYQSGRFLYVLNGGDSTTGAGAGVALFFIGGQGTLSYQATYTSQGTFPQTIVTDASGTHLYVLDEYAPAVSVDGAVTATPCVDSAGVAHPTGEVTVFSVDSSTGRLILITNSAQRDSQGNNLSYFPVGCFPIDAAIASSYLYTVEKGAVAGATDEVFVYGAATTGQLTLTASSTLATMAYNATAIVASSSSLYLLDAGPNPTSSSNQSTIYAYTAGGAGGSISIEAGGIVANDPQVENPVALLVEQKTHNFLYVANAGPDTSTAGTTSNSSISAFSIVSGQLSLFTADEPIPTGVSPRCIVEDPSNQYVYTANHDDNTVSAHLLDTEHGTMTTLRHGSSTFPTGGNPTWCVVSGITQ